MPHNPFTKASLDDWQHLEIKAALPDESVTFPAQWKIGKDEGEQVHRILRQIIDRGRADGTIRQNVTPREIVVFGAMLAQPRGPDPGWDSTCRRLLATYLAGLGTPTSP